MPLVISAFLTDAAATEIPLQAEWTWQGGTPNRDTNNSITVDLWGNFYIAGDTEGDFEGTNAGRTDAVVAKYSPTGTRIWARQFGTAENEASTDIKVDALGNVYLSGYSYGAIDGNTNSGYSDAFVSKLDGSGNTIWSRMVGGGGHDSGSTIALDSQNNVYIAGQVQSAIDGNTFAGFYDSFLTKFDSSGNKLWTRLNGTGGFDSSSSVAVDADDNVYISGFAAGAMDGQPYAGDWDAFVTKYNPAGGELWTRQIGTAASDGSNAITVDNTGNIYISGRTREGLESNTHLGGHDAFVAKFDSSGNKLWVKQFGTPEDDYGLDITADGQGNLFITGFTVGGLESHTNAGQKDVFLAKFDSAGNQLWAQQYGTAFNDTGSSLALGASGDLYLGGYTGGGLNGNTNPTPFFNDFFVIKFDEQITLPGDLDGDGFVGINDLNIVLNAWNQNVPPANSLADPSGDGFVGVEDLNIVLGNWNVGTPPTDGTNIPEPASLTLLGVCGLILLPHRR